MASVAAERWRAAIREVVRSQRFYDALNAPRCVRAIQAGLVLDDELARMRVDQPERHELGPQLGALLDSGRFADVVVRVGQEEIRAHSAILAARSRVFEAMWSSGMREEQQREVHIKDLDPVAVQRMLRFMYTGALDMNFEKDAEVVALLEVAHQYDVASLVELCVATLASWLTEDKAAEYLMIAETAGLDSFRQRCLDFITSSHTRVAEVQASEAFIRLAEKRPHLAVEILAKAIPPAKRARSSSLGEPASPAHGGASAAPSAGAAPGAGATPFGLHAAWLHAPSLTAPGPLPPGPPPPTARPPAPWQPPAPWTAPWRPQLLGLPPPAPPLSAWGFSAPSMTPAGATTAGPVLGPFAASGPRS